VPTINFLKNSSKTASCGILIKIKTPLAKILVQDGISTIMTIQTQQEVNITSSRADSAVSLSLDAMSLCAGGYNSGLGWNFGAPAPAAASMPQPPSPRYSSRSHEDDGEPGVQEVFTAVNAGAQSFAHYIVKVVSLIVYCILLFPPNPMIHGDALELKKSRFPLKSTNSLATSLFRSRTLSHNQRRLAINSMLNIKFLLKCLPISGFFSIFGSSSVPFKVLTQKVFIAKRKIEYLHYSSSIFCLNQQKSPSASH
jgi:hypothetical protein